MTDLDHKAAEPIATALAEHIPPMELDHKAALELLYQQQIREMSEPDFDAMVRGYREIRRLEAAKRLERDRKRAVNIAKKADLEVKRRAKAAAKTPTPTPDQASPKGGGGGNSV